MARIPSSLGLLNVRGRAHSLGRRRLMRVRAPPRRLVARDHARVQDCSKYRHHRISVRIFKTKKQSRVKCESTINQKPGLMA